MHSSEIPIIQVVEIHVLNQNRKTFKEREY